MVHETRSGKKNEADEGNNGEGSCSFGTGKMNHLGLRKSSQEMPSGTWKSKILEKQPPPTQRRSGRSDTPSPSRNSSRVKRHIISNSSVANLLEEELDLFGTKKKGEEYKSVKNFNTMKSEKDGTSSDHNISMKRKRMDARSFSSLFKQQRTIDAIPATYDVSQRSSKFPRFGSDDNLVEDKVNGVVDSHREVKRKFGEDHAALSDEVEDTLSCSEDFIMGAVHNHDGAGLPHAKDISTSAEAPSACLSEADKLESSTNGCIISAALDRTEKLLEGHSGRETEKVPNVTGSTPLCELNSINGDQSRKRNSDSIQTICELVSVTAQSTFASHEKHCFPGSCGTCMKQKSQCHDSPSVELCTCGALPKDISNKTLYKDKVSVEATASGKSKGANMVSEVDNLKNACDACKQDGKSLLCYGEGCSRCYHLSCLGPPLDDVPSGIWHCLWCVKKKIELGVHAVSKGVESICDAREVEMSGSEGTRKQKQYLVKYQGLAHAYNQWLPEAPLLIEVPSILAEFNQKSHDVTWNSEWTKPQRLLRKRLLSFSKLHGENQNLDVGDNLKCQYEWLVKWKGLDIEDATWELENADSLCTSHGLSLIREYESCQGKQSDIPSNHTANDNGLGPSKFLEYWIPVQVSNLQLEQYCNTLLSNVNALCSYTKKSDPVGVLNTVLLDLRKCCDHPYIFDGSVLPLNKGLSPTEILDFGINASGKLLLLDKMLSEMKHKHLSVVIYFQDSIGPVSSLVNILEEFLRGRFGEDSYECVHTYLHASKRQAALNKFMKKESGQFVLLLESRICNASIRLSSVDSVIIYGGDNNPRNDLRLIQKLSFMSLTEPIRVFRLYSCFTVEEQALVIAKQDPNVDNLLSLNRNLKCTLMWGASLLFSRLEEYHSSDCQASASDMSHEQLFINDVIKEFCTIVSPNREMDAMHESVISKVLKSSGPCITDLPLFGEQRVKYTHGEEPQVFWKRLLEGRSPQWRHISGPTPRNRKRVKYFESSPRTPEVSNDEAGKKRRKMVNSGVDAIPTLHIPEGVQLAASKEGVSTTRSSSSPSNVVDVENVERKSLLVEQKTLHIFLKEAITKVFEVLKLSNDVKYMVGRLLDYIMENLRVCGEPPTLQALQVSLCRMSAKLLKRKAEVSNILKLTKEHLKFECTEAEVDKIYMKLRSKKEAFLRHLEKTGFALKPLKGMENVATDIIMDTTCIREHVAQQTTGLKGKVVESEMDKMIRQVQCKCDMRMSRLKEKQQEEIEIFQKDCEVKRMAIEKLHKVQLIIIQAIHCNTMMGKNKVKQLNDDIARELAEHNRLKDLKLNEIEEKHEKERVVEMQKAVAWVAKAKLCCIDGVAAEPHSSTSDSRNDAGDLQCSADSDIHISDSKDVSRNLQDIAYIGNSIFHVEEADKNLRDIADARKISDSRDNFANLQDCIHAYKNTTEVAASGHVVGDLEDNTCVDIINHPSNVPPRDDIGNIQGDAVVYNPPSVASPSGCNVQGHEPSIVLIDEPEHSVEPSNMSTFTTDVVQSKEFVTNTSSEKPTETISSAEASVPSHQLPNEICNIVSVVPSAFEKLTVDEISVGAHSDGVIHDHISEDTVHVVPLTSENLTVDKATIGVSVGAHSEDVTSDHASHDTVHVVQLTSKEHAVDDISVDVYSEEVTSGHPSEGTDDVVQLNSEKHSVDENSADAYSGSAINYHSLEDTVHAVLSTSEKHTINEISVGAHSEDVLIDHPSEDTVPMIQSTSKEHPVDEISVGLHSEGVISDHPSEDTVPVFTFTSENHDVIDISVGVHSEDVTSDNPSVDTVHVPLTFENQTVDDISVSALSEDVIRGHPSEDTIPVVPLFFEKQTVDEISVGARIEDAILDHNKDAHVEDVICDHVLEDTVPVIPLTVQKHTAGEISVGVHREDVLQGQSSEVPDASITTGGLMVNGCTPTNKTDFLNNDGNQNGAANKSADNNSASQEILFALPNVQTGACSDDGGISQQDQVPYDQSCQLSASIESQCNHGNISESEAAPPLLDAGRPVMLWSCESSLSGNREPQLPPSGGLTNRSDQLPLNRENKDSHCSEPSNVTLHQSQTNLEANSTRWDTNRSDQLPSRERHCTPQITIPPREVRVINRSDQLPLNRENNDSHGSEPSSNVTLYQSQTDLEVNRTRSQPGGERRSIPQITIPPHEARVTRDLPNQANVQPSNMTSIPGPNNVRMSHLPHFLTPVNPPGRVPFNPLSKELERLRNEIEVAVKSHEDWKVQQRSECENEIKEVVAQICKKYEAKIMDGEAALLKRKSELEANQSKVLRHKILAEAYRSKCLEPRWSAALPQMQQVRSENTISSPAAVHPGYVQHVPMLPPLRTAFSPPSLHTPSPTVSSLRPPPGFSSPGQHSIANHHQASSTPHPSRTYHTNPSPTSRSTPSVSIAFSSGPLSAVPNRPPFVGDVSPAPGSIRTPAPHLQLFRPISLPSTAPSVPSFPQMPPQPPQAVSSQPPQKTGPTPLHPQLTAGHKNTEANNTVLPNNTSLPPLPEIGVAFDLVDLSEFEPTTGTSAPQVSAVADVVCLSDDD
ncbi:unnamed protein product [Cuscuta epithymum]|uniref:Uncharacterized protein n=1 Tax=Cuscuta epithymum TaxID=186058 RepID=A0AAV0EJE2_9ASTE|nr:unnamed protein product [Cuscuta epithymum]